MGLVLDNVWILRTALSSATLFFFYLISLPNWILRFVVSKAFWMQYPQWSRLTRLPLVLKFWGGKALLQYLWLQYLKLETKLILALSEIETQIVEPNLPIIA